MKSAQARPAKTVNREPTTGGVGGERTRNNRESERDYTMDGNVRMLYKYRAGFLVPATKSDDVYVLQRKETSRDLEIAVYVDK